MADKNSNSGSSNNSISFDESPHKMHQISTGQTKALHRFTIRVKQDPKINDCNVL